MEERQILVVGLTTETKKVHVKGIFEMFHVSRSRQLYKASCTNQPSQNNYHEINLYLMQQKHSQVQRHKLPYHTFRRGIN
jgi:hypothetical protein